MNALARLGGVLLILGIVAVTLIGVRGILGVVGIMAIYSDPFILGLVSVVLFGSGAALIGLAGSGVMAATAPRSGFILFAIGCFSIALLLAATQDVVSGSLGVSPSIYAIGGAGLLAPIGLLVIGVSLVRSSGPPMIAGLLISVGGGLTVLGLFSSSVLGSDVSRALLFVGASIVGAGLLGVGLLVGGVRRSLSDGAER